VRISKPQRILRISLLFTWIFLYVPHPASAQREIDRIVAVVGNEVILLSELTETVIVTAQQLNLSVEDSLALEGLKRDMLDGMIEEKVILQRAKVEGIEISEDELNSEVEKDLNKVIARFSSRTEFEMLLASQGIDLFSYREQLRKEKEKVLLQRRFMQTSKMPHVRVSLEEARKQFDEKYEGKAMKPATVTLREIVLKISLSDSNYVKAREGVRKAQARLVDGEIFETVAKEMSQDELTRDKGGDLGFISEVDLLPVISDAVTRLFLGEVSEPVETGQGIHLFKVLERKGSRIHLSHILFKAAPGVDPFEETMSLAKALVGRIEAGEDFALLSSTYSTDERVKERMGQREEEVIEGLPESYRAVLGELEEGEVSSPFVAEDKIVIVKLEKKTDARLYRFDEISDQLIENLTQEKSYQRFVEELEKKTYINIRL